MKVNWRALGLTVTCRLTANVLPIRVFSSPSFSPSYFSLQMFNWGAAGSSSPSTETTTKEKTCAPKLELPLEPEKKDKMKDNKHCILAVLRLIVAIFSL